MTNDSMVGGARRTRRTRSLIVAALTAGAALSAGAMVELRDGHEGHEDSKLIKIEETTTAAS